MRAVLLGVFVLGCGDGPGARTIRGEPTLETFTDRMCKCTDPACAQQVIADLAHWSKVVRKPPNDSENTARLMERYNGCMVEAIGRASRAPSK